jgi:hypothetical protein
MSTIHKAVELPAQSENMRHFLQQNREIEDLLVRLAKANGKEVTSRTKICYVTALLWFLAQKIVEHDHGDLTAYAALPALLHELCGGHIPPATE